MGGRRFNVREHAWLSGSLERRRTIYKFISIPSVLVALDYWQLVKSWWIKKTVTGHEQSFADHRDSGHGKGVVLLFAACLFVLVWRAATTDSSRPPGTRLVVGYCLFGEAQSIDGVHGLPAYLDYMMIEAEIAPTLLVYTMPRLHVRLPRQFGAIGLWWPFRISHFTLFSSHDMTSHCKIAPKEAACVRLWLAN